MSFSVRVPNRAPNFISDMTEAAVPVNRSLEWNLLELFEEPDREEMTFDATSSNSGTVGVNRSGSVVEVTGLAAGESRVTLTPTDPHGEEGTGMVDVTVLVPVVLVNDDFESDESLDDWEINDGDVGSAEHTSVKIENGYLVVTADTSEFASVGQDLGGEAEDWTVDVVLRNPDEDAQSGFFVFTGHDTYPWYVFMIGEVEIGGNIGTPNWIFGWRDLADDALYVDAWSYGVSDDISDFADHEISVSLMGDSIRGTLDGRRLFSHRDEDYLLNTAVGFSLGTGPETEDGGDGSMDSARFTAAVFTSGGSQPDLRADVARALGDLRLRLRRK